MLKIMLWFQIEIEKIILNELNYFNTSDRLAIEIGELQKKIKSAKENKENFDILKEKINSLRKEKKVNETKIEEAKKKNVLYHRANKPTLDAQKCIARYESYEKYMSLFA